MEYNTKNIIIESSIDNLLSSKLILYIAHIICHQGSFQFCIGERKFTLNKGETMVVNTIYPLADFETTKDFEVQVVYINPSFIEEAIPYVNHGIYNTLILLKDPIIKINSKEYELLKQDINNIEERLAHSTKDFMHEVMMCAVKSLYLDYSQILNNQYPHSKEKNAGTTLMLRFLHLLEMGHYRKYREVAWYASKLCVTPKYLSEVCNRVSGHSAIFWINRFTTVELGRLIQNRNIPIARISEQFGFSSPSYFSRFFLQHFGQSPSTYRK